MAFLFVHTGVRRPAQYHLNLNFTAGCHSHLSETTGEHWGVRPILIIAARASKKHKGMSSVAGIRRMTAQSTVFMVCDVQERFASVIYQFPALVHTSTFLAASARVLEMFPESNRSKFPATTAPSPAFVPCSPGERALAQFCEPLLPWSDAPTAKSEPRAWQ